MGLTSRVATLATSLLAATDQMGSSPRSVRICPVQPPGHIHRRAEQAAGAGDIHKQMAVILARFDQGRIGQRLLEQGPHGPFVAIGMGRQHGGIGCTCAGPGASAMPLRIPPA